MADNANMQQEIVMNGDQTGVNVSSGLREGVLLGYGNPLLDIQVVGTEEFLQKYDLKADNAILAEEKHKPMYQELVDSFTDVQYVPGGATLNAIKVAQKIVLVFGNTVDPDEMLHFAAVHLGFHCLTKIPFTGIPTILKWWLLQTPNATSFFGCVSKDKFGRLLEDKARESGVNVQFQFTDKEPTGTCGVIVTGDKRSLCANLAAANCFTEDHLDVAHHWDLVEKANFFYCAGFPLTVSPSTILRIAKHAHEKHKTFVMNLSAPFLCQFFKEPMLQILPYVDIIFGNESEAAAFSEANQLEEVAAFSEANGLGTDDVKEIALKIAAWNKENKKRSRLVIITQGDLPAVVAKDGKVTEYPVIPIKSADIVDTNGAGDAFVGGFLSQLILGKSIEECMRCGHYAANLVIQRSGCTTPERPDFS